MLKLVHRDPQGAPLDRAKAVRRPAVGGGCDPLVELGSPRGDRFGDTAGPRVDLARVL